MSYTPGENTDGYEDAVEIVKDEGTMSERTLWTDKCSSCEFRANGVVAKPKMKRNKLLRIGFAM